MTSKPALGCPRPTPCHQIQFEFFVRIIPWCLNMESDNKRERGDCPVGDLEIDPESTYELWRIDECKHGGKCNDITCEYFKTSNHVLIARGLTRVEVEEAVARLEFNVYYRKPDEISYHIIEVNPDYINRDCMLKSAQNPPWPPSVFTTTFYDFNCARGYYHSRSYVHNRYNTGYWLKIVESSEKFDRWSAKILDCNSNYGEVRSSSDYSATQRIIYRSTGCSCEHCSPERNYASDELFDRVTNGNLPTDGFIGTYFQLLLRFRENMDSNIRSNQLNPAIVNRGVITVLVKKLSNDMQARGK